MAKNDTQYDPARYETDIYRQWEESGAFEPSPEALAAGREPYVIMLPPPNITGSLHMGHALQDTIMDILVRWHRLQGEPVLWLPGTDSAAIATNRVIENQLTEEGTTRFDIGREAFLQRTEEWYEKTGAQIIDQMKRLGCSCDWSRSRFTMDDDYLRSVNEAFIRYHDAGYLYRGARIVNWDPATQTTVSDLEIDWQTQQTPFYTFQYGPFQISTARPETKFGDKYVVMHPDDERYASYAEGDTFEAEWINGPVTATVVKDEAVDPTFGTGVMTITPWHDATDFAIAERHELDREQIIGFDGKLLPIAGDFAGQDIAKARAGVVKRLEERGLLVSVDESYRHNVALNDRGKGVIEPQVMRQWFVRMDKLKEQAIAAAEQEAVRFVPPRWKQHFSDWMGQVYDWNINRQIWLGHRLPVWWKTGTHGTDNEEGNYVVSVDPPFDSAQGKPDENWEQDPDVLDTWFATALWPFATLGWPDATNDLKTFYPSSVLVTARDILYLWVARMVFSGVELMQGSEYGDRDLPARVPFKDVFIHPTVLAKDGRRMSKSLGTGMDPLELTTEYGADATRFGLMYMMSYDNQAIRFDEATIKAARNFANKVWNLGRFLQGMTERDEPTAADQWIEGRVGEVQGEVGQLLGEYKIGEAARLLYDFVWNDFADWYVEILKVGGSTVVARRVFIALLRSLHPFMPYITEVLWQQFKQEGLLISATASAEAAPVDSEAAGTVARLKDIVTTIRSARTLLAVPAGARVTIHLPNPPLAEALAVLARADVIPEATADMKRFPTPKGEVVALASEHITTESIAAARRKLEAEATATANFITTQQQALDGMQGKAPAQAIADKERIIAEAKQRQRELAESIAVLEQTN